MKPTFPQMLLNLHKKSWIDGLTLEDYGSHCETNQSVVKEMLELAKNYNKVCVCVCVYARVCACE